MALRLRRGTDAERLLIVPAAGELIYTTDTKRVYVGDGATEGGLPIDTGALAINDLSDVNTTEGDSTQPADGEALVWDQNNQEWRPGVVSGGGGVTSIINLDDVSVAGLVLNQYLAWDGDNFVNTTPNFQLVDETFPTLSAAMDADGFNISNVGILSATTLEGDGSAITNLNIARDTTPQLGGALDANNNNITNVNQLNATTIIGDGAGITNVPFNLIQDTSPRLGGTLDANNNNITGVNSLSAQSISGDGSGIFGLDISTDTTPELGGNLNIGGFNITGTGTIQVTGNMQCDVFVSNIASSRFYGDLTGSIFADDSASFYDSINHTANADTITANTELVTPTITSVLSEISLGSSVEPKRLKLYVSGADNPVEVFKSGNEYSGYLISSSAGTISAPTAHADGEVIGAYRWKTWDGSAYNNSGIIANVVDGTISAGITPSKLQFASYDSAGNPNIMEYDATGTLSVANATISGKLNLTATVPANAGDTGTVGEIRVDADHIYVCTASNTWKRVAIATWP